MSTQPSSKPRSRELPEQYDVEGLTPTREGLVPLRLGVDRRLGEFVPPGNAPLLPLIPDDCWWCPGFLDIHVHCRDDPSGQESHKEDYRTASLAALHGGVVAVGDMPNNPEPPVDLPRYQRKRTLVEERALIDVAVYGGVTREGGAFTSRIPWKCYFGPSVGELHEESDTADTLAPYRGEWVAFHAEDPQILEASRNATTHEDRRPPEAERVAVAKILRLARELGFHPHIAHLSTEGGLREIEQARRDGLDVTCEVAPHHLFFDRENRTKFRRGEWLQMNPPLRTPADRRALIEGLREGSIDIVATDHAPHSLEENARGISGVPLLDTFAPFLGWLVAEEGFDWPTLIERACLRPAQLFAPFLRGRYGVLEPSATASYTILNPKAPWTVEAEQVQSRAAWSPFEGVTFPISVHATAIRGHLYEM